MCCRQGPLLCCDTCPRAFHKDCHIPSAEAKRSVRRSPPASCTHPPGSRSLRSGRDSRTCESGGRRGLRTACVAPGLSDSPVSVGLRLGHLAPCCHRPRKCPCLGLQQTPVPEGWRREMAAVCVLRLCRKGRKGGLVPMGWCRPRSPGVEVQF